MDEKNTICSYRSRCKFLGFCYRAIGVYILLACGAISLGDRCRDNPVTWHQMPCGAVSLGDRCCDNPVTWLHMPCGIFGPDLCDRMFNFVRLTLFFPPTVYLCSRIFHCLTLKLFAQGLRYACSQLTQCCIFSLSLLL